MRKRTIVIALALSTALAALTQAPITTRAAVLIALGLPELVSQSEYVVIARAQNESSRYAGTLIVTDVSLRVITSLKGTAKPGDKLTVTHLGGAVDRVGLQVPGAAHFELGESAVVFLRRHADGTLNVTGMSQGVLPISGAGVGAEVESAGSGGAQLMQRDGKGALVDMPSQPARKRALAELLAEIDELVQKR